MRIKPLLAAFLVLLPVVAFADDSPVLGRWTETLPNGKHMVTEFTPTTLSSTPTDDKGALLVQPNVFAVSYKPLGHSDKGDSYEVDFDADKGKKKGGLMLFLKDRDSMLMDFPGMGAHNLTRVKP